MKTNFNKMKKPNLFYLFKTQTHEPTSSTTKDNDSKHLQHNRTFTSVQLAQ